MNGKGTAGKVGDKPFAKAPARLLGWYAVQWNVAGRVGLLFTALCLIKLVMLAGFQKYLTQTHWRIEAVPSIWVDQAVFYAFAILVGVSNLRPSRRLEMA